MKKITVGLTILALALVTASCSKKESTNKNAEVKTTQSTRNNNTESSSKQIKSSNQTKDIAISLDNALKKYDEEYPDTSVISVELDESFGSYYYKIEGVDDTKEYGVRVKADSGEVKKEREETLDKDEQGGVKKRESALDTKELIPLKEISTLAEKEIGKGTAKEWKLEQELGVTYWEVKVVDEMKDYEVKLNAKNGEILEKSED